MTKATWLVPTGLIALSFVPMAAGTIRLVELGGGGTRTPDNARFFDQPLPVVLHIISASVFLLLGAFQFSPGLRRRRAGWHRAAGRLLIPLGIVAALTGLWMSVMYDLPPADGTLVMLERLLFGTVMAVALGLGFAAARRRDFPTHSAWVTRGYAIGLGAGTQAITHAPWFLFVGEPGPSARAFLMGAGWVINLAVAEWAIRRRRAKSQQRPSRSAPVPATP
ncbi:DUF2306 domain-containing protein [Dactylosporangium sp. NPDC050588]|uniref:DUF2306 domain-containing protein n=1 Tax=Dactylosporangium sp. NPDC050588 TaxID=3157211 RepID=UPI0033DBCA68